MDSLTKNFLGDLFLLLGVLIVAIALFWRYPDPGVLFGGSLAVTAVVAAEIILLRK